MEPQTGTGSDEIHDVAMRHGCGKQDANEVGTEVKEVKPRFDGMRHSVRLDVDQGSQTADASVRTQGVTNLP